MNERTQWPTEDGGEYCIEGAAMDWEANASRRLFDLYSDELDKIGGPQKRLITVSDARVCYLAALRALTAQIELTATPLGEAERGGQ